MELAVSGNASGCYARFALIPPEIYIFSSPSLLTTTHQQRIIDSHGSADSSLDLWTNRTRNCV